MVIADLVKNRILRFLKEKTHIIKGAVLLHKKEIILIEIIFVVLILMTNFSFEYSKIFRFFLYISFFF